VSMYQSILVAVDLHEKITAQVLQKAQAIQQVMQAKIVLYHVVEQLHLYGEASVFIDAQKIQQEQLQQAKQQLTQLAEQYQLKQAQIIVDTGLPKAEIVERAKADQMDLILLGSHGRHGLQLLLGSTANAVLHHAHCDVLAVHLKD